MVKERRKHWKNEKKTGERPIKWLYTRDNKQDKSKPMKLRAREGEGGNERRRSVGKESWGKRGKPTLKKNGNRSQQISKAEKSHKRKLKGKRFVLFFLVKTEENEHGEKRKEERRQALQRTGKKEQKNRE